MLGAMLAALAAALAPGDHLVRLVHMDAMEARTTARLWHELHVARGQAHDFAPALAPAPRATYVALAAGGVVRALAACDRPARTPCVAVVAHHPDHAPAAAALVRRLAADGVPPAWDQLRRQPRLYLEGLYAAPPDE